MRFWPWVCDKCKFRWWSDTHPLRCPECGSNEVSQDDAGGAE